MVEIEGDIVIIVTTDGNGKLTVYDGDGNVRAEQSEIHGAKTFREAGRISRLVAAALQMWEQNIPPVRWAKKP